MDNRMDMNQAKQVAEFPGLQKKDFWNFFTPIIKASGKSEAELSMALGRAKNFLSAAPINGWLLCEKEIIRLLKLMDLNDGLAEAAWQKWQKNYEAGMRKLFADSADLPFLIFFQTARELVEITAALMSMELGGYSIYIYQLEEKNGYFREEKAEKAAEIICPTDKLADLKTEFMARWKKHYGTWQKRPTNKGGGQKIEIPRPDIDQEKLEDIFLDYDDKPFPALFKAVRELAGIYALALSTALGKDQAFVGRVENCTEKLTRELTRKSAEILGLKKAFALEFMGKWEAENEITGEKDNFRQRINFTKPIPPPESPEQTMLESVIASPLGRLADLLCYKAGFSDGIMYLHRNREINLYDLRPEADNGARLAALIILARKLKLGGKEIHELATILFASYAPGKYLIAAEGSGLDFFDLAIKLAAKSTKLTVGKIKMKL
ncbi:MAG: hypothetical protein Q8O93_05235 [bacterium]|nr:hypothetical protein [bacterium]